jgi:hypothetical protein
MHTHPLCRSTEVTFRWPGTQKWKTVHSSHGECYMIVQRMLGHFRWNRDELYGSRL